jgi:hypothetical protein
MIFKDSRFIYEDSQKLSICQKSIYIGDHFTFEDTKKTCLLNLFMESGLLRGPPP